MKWWRTAGVAVVTVVGLSTLGALGNENEPPKARTGAGAPEVYAQIAAETDCLALQETFDRAANTSNRGGQWRKIGLDYMDAADARLRELECYDR